MDPGGRLTLDSYHTRSRCRRGRRVLVPTAWLPLRQAQGLPMTKGEATFHYLLSLARRSTAGPLGSR